MFSEWKTLDKLEILPQGHRTDKVRTLRLLELETATTSGRSGTAYTYMEHETNLKLLGVANEEYMGVSQDTSMETMTLF